MSEPLSVSDLTAVRAGWAGRLMGITRTVSRLFGVPIWLIAPRLTDPRPPGRAHTRPRGRCRDRRRP